MLNVMSCKIAEMFCKCSANVPNVLQIFCKCFANVLQMFCKCSANILQMCCSFAFISSVIVIYRFPLEPANHSSKANAAHYTYKVTCRVRIPKGKSKPKKKFHPYLIFAATWSCLLMIKLATASIILLKHSNLMINVIKSISEKNYQKV